ncbi:hypothetical protein O6H91_14G013500 [Diphasiastrum complanatum]|uniref:Uncharacterized protein n=1 Tax=Diphasiastrum complanatum TaxID=34168 RepID=A0ACC2BLN4_DIPCM|nr:hypothetical protein O6H91_14G013500 [Diphasiastrum complanatum]
MDSSSIIPSSPHNLSPHVLLLALPALGHVNALFHLAKLLSFKGVAITYVCAHHCISILERELHAANSSANALIRLVGLPERVSLGDGHIASSKVFFEVVCGMKDDFMQLVKQQLQIAGGERETQASFAAPSAILSDNFIFWARDVAIAFNLAHYVFFPFSASPLTVMLSLPLLISQGHVPLKSAAELQLITLPSLPPLWNKDLPTCLHDVDGKAELEWKLTCGFNLIKASTILINTSYEMEANAIEALQSKDGSHQTKQKVLTVGPVLPRDFPNDHRLHSESENPGHTECSRWLNSKNVGSVLYVSFGSIYSLGMEEITELALGLEASSYAFLWVLRQPRSASSKNNNSLLSDLLPEGFQSRLKDRCFISSGLIVDQLKIGIELPKDHRGFPSREEIETTTRLLMEGEGGRGVKKNVAALKDIIRKSVKKGGSSYENVEAFVHEIFQLSATHSKDESHANKNISSTGIG